MNREKEKTELGWRKKTLPTRILWEVLKKTGVPREKTGLYLSSEDPMMQEQRQAGRGWPRKTARERKRGNMKVAPSLHAIRLPQGRGKDCETRQKTLPDSV